MNFGIMFYTRADQPPMVKLCGDEQTRDEEWEKVIKSFQIDFGRKTIDIIQCLKVTADNKICNYPLMTKQRKEEKERDGLGESISSIYFGNECYCFSFKHRSIRHSD